MASKEGLPTGEVYTPRPVRHVLALTPPPRPTRDPRTHHQHQRRLDVFVAEPTGDQWNEGRCVSSMCVSSIDRTGSAAVSGGGL